MKIEEDKEVVYPDTEKRQEWRTLLLSMHFDDEKWSFMVDRVITAWIGFIIYEVPGYTIPEIDEMIFRMRRKRQ